MNYLAERFTHLMYDIEHPTIVPYRGSLVLDERNKNSLVHICRMKDLERMLTSRMLTPLSSEAKVQSAIEKMYARARELQFRPVGRYLDQNYEIITLATDISTIKLIFDLGSDRENRTEEGTTNYRAERYTHLAYDIDHPVVTVGDGPLGRLNLSSHGVYKREVPRRMELEELLRRHNLTPESSGAEVQKTLKEVYATAKELHDIPTVNVNEVNRRNNTLLTLARDIPTIRLVFDVPDKELSRRLHSYLTI